MVLLHDMSDYGNAGAGTVPQNSISIAIAPVSYAFETAPSNERINNTMNHELVHIVASDQACASDNFFRSLFHGKVAETAENPLTILYSHLTVPRRSAPRWYHEGIAVFLETWMSGGFGRALGAYDEMVFRTMVRDSARIYDLIGIESEGTKVDFQLGVNSYLYGTRFMSYLALKYGPQSLIEWTARKPGSKAYFAAQFHHIYGISLDDAWHAWIDWEKEFQQSNLDSLRKYPISSLLQLSKEPLGSVSRPFYDSKRRELITGINYPGQLAYIGAINVDNGSIRKICDLKGAALILVASLAYDEDSGTIFFTTDNNEWRDLCAVNIAGGSVQRLIKDARVGDLAFSRSDKSLWGVRHAHGISTIVRMLPPYREWDQIYSWPYSRDLYDIDISPDGKSLSGALAEVNGNQHLILMSTDSLIAGDTTFRSLYEFGVSNPASFVFSADGLALYGSSYYSGVSNIFRYDITNDSMDARSNCETGLFMPVQATSDSLIAFSFTGKGFVPVKLADQSVKDINAITYLGQLIVDQHPIVTEWIAPPPSSINIDSLTTYRGNYHAISSIRIVSAYPVVEGYDEFAAFGMRMNFSGPLSTHTLHLTTSYTPNQRLPRDERFHASAGFEHSGWSIDGEYNAADFYDLFGPTKSSRKGYSLGVHYRKSLLNDGPKSAGYNAGITGYGGLRKLPEYQNITTSYDRFVNLDASIRFSNLRASIGAIDFEKGILGSISGSGKFVNKKVFPRVHTRFDFGFPFLFKNSSLWFRTYAGYSPSRREEPLGNFYFGGFGNNWIDYLSEKRYRNYYSFPGIELNAVAGTNFGKITTELVLPPIRFRRAGVPTLFCSWTRVALIGSLLTTNIDDELLRTELATAGAQLDMHWIMLSRLNLVLSFGIAQAMTEHNQPEREYMISLKIL